MTVIVMGHFRIPAEHRAEAVAAMARVVSATREEAGCIAYSYGEDVIEPGLFRVSEAWASREALAVHFEAPHMKQWQRERAGFGMTDRMMTAYSVAGEEAL